MLGQILYLEAEAAGVHGTGIGWFFDDAVHGVLGLNDLRWQSLYHFTVGEPLRIIACKHWRLMGIYNLDPDGHEGARQWL